MYAVYGKSKVKAMQKAEKIVEAVVKGKALTMAEYTERLESKAAEIYADSRPGKISTLYSSRREAEEYADMVRAAGTAENISIRRKDCDRDALNNPIINPKTKKPISKWVTL